MNSALDAMVEELVKRWREVQVDRITQQLVAEGREAAGEAASEVDAQVWAVVEPASTKTARNSSAPTWPLASTSVMIWSLSAEYVLDGLATGPPASNSRTARRASG